MENKFKRFLSLALALFMVISMMPTNIAFATENTHEHTYGEDNVCTVDGCGETKPTEESENDFSENEATPSEATSSENDGLDSQTEDEDQVVDDTNYVAKIGETGYATFADAMTAASAMTGDVEVEIYGEVEFGGSLTGNYTSISFVGKTTDAKIASTVNGYIQSSSSVKVNFTDLILSKPEGSYITNAGFMNCAFTVYQAGEVNYTSCIFSNGACASGSTTTYTGCTFHTSHDKYSLWAYGNTNVTVDNCTFADYRGIKMYAEGAAKVTNLTVKNSNFSALDSKPAIVLTYGESVTLEGNTYSSTGVFELDLDGAPNGTAVESDVAPTCKNDNGACGVLVDGKIYTTVAQAAEVATSGSTVTLLHNSTETVELPEGVTLEKNGYEAANVTVAAPETPAASGTFNGGHMNLEDSAEIFITSEIVDLNATESVVVKIYSGETLIATTTLLKNEYFVMDSLSVKTCLTGDSSSWSTVWEAGMPRADLAPTSGTLYVDGTKMNSAAINMRDTADAAVDWTTLEGVNPAPSAGPVEVDLSQGSYTITEAGEYIVSAYTGANTLTIKADATVTLNGVTINALADNSAISIESGNVTLNVNADSTVTGGDNGAGIYVAEGAAVTVKGGKLTAIGNAGADDAFGAAGIGGTWANGNSGAITIDGATVVAKGYGNHGSGIGSGSGKVVGEIKIINGANVTAQGGYYADGAGTKLQSSYGKSDPEGGAAIGGGGKTAATIANITITDSTVVANGGSKAAGIGANFWSSCGTITISGSSNVTAQGGSSSAGIGTSRAGDTGVSANIEISGGTVTATGGAYGAGIGAGYNADSLGNGADASALPETSITISDGTVTATGGEGGAAIGGGYKSDNVDIDITGGKITATAGALVSGKTVENGGAPAAIGSGANGSGVFENSPAVVIDNTAEVEVTSYYGGKSAVEGITNEELAEKSNVTLNEEGKPDLIISTAEELFAFAKDVNENKNGYSGKLVVLAANIDLNNAAWTPIGASGDSEPKFRGTFDGQGHTISNLYVKQGAAYHSAGLFGATNGTIKNLTIDGAYVESLSSESATVNGTAVVAGSTAYGATIDNVHVKNATVKGNRYVAGIVGYMDGSVTNCSVENVTIVATPDDLTGSYDNGDKVGGIVGYCNSDAVEITGCELKGTVSITAYRDVAGIVGCAITGVAVTNNTNNATLTVTVDQKTNAYGEKDANAGEFIGRNTPTSASGNTRGQSGSYTSTVKTAPKGDITIGYVTANHNNSGKSGVFGEAKNVVGTESFEVKLYSGETLVGTAALVDTDKVLLNGKSQSITWHILTTEDDDSWWDTDWVTALNANAIPDKVELYVDGVLVSTGEVELNNTDLSAPICAAVTDEDGNVQSFVAGTGWLNAQTAPVYTDALQTAFTAGGNIVMLRDVTAGVLTVGADMTLDLNGHTVSLSQLKIASKINVEVKNGTLVGTSADNDTIRSEVGNLTLTDVNVSGLRHTVRIKSGTATINGGTYTYGGTTTVNKTLNVINVGDDEDPENTKATVTIKGGTFIAGYPTTYDGGSAVKVQKGSTVTIEGGNFSNGYTTLNADDGATLSVTGGTYDQDPTAYVADGYAALPNLNDQYVVGEKPTATVNNLGKTTVAAGDYMVYGNGDNTAEMPLSFVMQFLADQTEEDMATSPYADWYGDFVITFTGIENGSFTADGCYLAGHYGSFGWVKVPVDSMPIEEGERYPVMLGVGMGQKYNYICSSVQDFKCALYLTPEILEANPNLQVNLELSIVDNSKGSDAAASALMNNESIYKVTDYTYEADDFLPAVAKIGDVQYATIDKAIEAAESGDTVTLLADVTLTDSILIDKSLTIDLGGKIITSANNRVIKINTASNGAESVTIKNGTVTSTASAGRCIQVAGSALKELTVDTVTLTATNGETQPITLSEQNSEELLKVTIKNSTVTASNNNAYAMIAFCPIDATIENSTLSGFAALYFKGDYDNTGVYSSEGSKVAVTNSILNGTNVQNGNNSFSVISFEAGNIEVTVTGGSINAAAAGDAAQGIMGAKDGITGITATLNTVLNVGENCGYFGMADIEEQKISVRAEYADELAALGYAYTDTATEGMISITGSAVAAINGFGYATLDEAFAAAEADQTVKLLDAATTGLLVVEDGITLDLNGYTLTADGLVAFGSANVVDNSSEMTGLLKIAQNRIALRDSNVQIPVWTGEGYKFNDIGFYRSNALKVEGGYEVRFRVVPNNAIAELLRDGAADNQLKIMIRLTWDTDPGAVYQDFTYGDAMVKEVFTANNGNESTANYFKLVITGVENVTGLKATPMVVSDLGAIDVPGSWTLN